MFQPKQMSDAAIETELKSRGIQPTAHRIAICRYVLCEADHPTADNVRTWAEHALPKVSLATVYNTLGTLVGAGLLRELRLPHSEAVIYDQNVQEHHHFLNEETGELVDVPVEQVEIHSNLSQGFRIRDVSLLLRGSRVGTESSSQASGARASGAPLKKEKP